MATLSDFSKILFPPDVTGPTLHMRVRFRSDPSRNRDGVRARGHKPYCFYSTSALPMGFPHWLSRIQNAYPLILSFNTVLSVYMWLRARPADDTWNFTLLHTFHDMPTDSDPTPLIRPPWGVKVLAVWWWSKPLPTPEVNDWSLTRRPLGRF